MSLTFRVIAPEVNYGKFTWGEKDPRREKLYEKIEQVLTEVPGVESVALPANLVVRQIMAVQWDEELVAKSDTGRPLRFLP